MNNGIKKTSYSIIPFWERTVWFGNKYCDNMLWECTYHKTDIILMIFQLPSKKNLETPLSGWVPRTNYTTEVLGLGTE